MPDTPDLAAIRKRAEKAKLPLSVSDTSSYSCGPIQNAPGLNVRDCEGWYDFFISRAGHTVQSWEEIKAKVLSINDIPALLAHIDAQAARITALERAARDYRQLCTHYRIGTKPRDALLDRLPVHDNILDEHQTTPGAHQ